MVHISISNNIKKILVDGYLESDDIKLLDKELSDNSIYSFKITFIDVKYISSIIFKDLYHIKDKTTIITTDRTLWYYLNKFNIKNIYKNSFNHIDNSIPHPIKAIGIGGSAGSLTKLISIVKSLPYCDISIFITIHILSNKQSYIVEILQDKTNYKVCEASHHIRVKKNCIYVAPPNHHIVVSDGFIYLSDDSEVRFARPSINVLFKSLTYEYKESLLAILLCGYGDDGVESLENLKGNGSEIIIEDPADCKAKDILLNAIKSKNYNKILKLEQIKKYIHSSLYTNLHINDEIDNFLENLYFVYGYDFRSYERKSITRRLDLVMTSNNFESFKQFKRVILDDTNLFEKLLKAFSINTTQFFRNPSVFKSLQTDSLSLFKNYPFIRVWCAGCSRGDEPYSIAMMLDEAGLLDKTQIYATDFNKTVLNEAQNAIYPKDLFEEFENNYIQSGGKNRFKEYFEINRDFIEVKKKIKDKVLFFEHNLVTDSSINEFHLIFCRNVLIYFNKSLQKRVFKIIDESLIDSGFLILGESELCDREYDYRVVGDKKNKIYQKGYKV